MTTRDLNNNNEVFQQDVSKEELKSVNGGGCPNCVTVGRICENNANLGYPVNIPHPGIPIGDSEPEI